MSRRRQYNTPSAQLRRLLEGCGSGDGKNFKPWTEVKDVPSRGRVHRLWCAKDERTDHLLSDLERNCHFLGEYLTAVKWMKQQYPLLSLTETLQLAKDLEIKRHPTHPDTGCPAVMTTDQIWTLAKRDHSTFEVALNCKYVADREMPRNQDKRRIEEAYHDRRDRPLLDFDETIVSDDFVVNWGFVRTLLRPEYANPQRDTLATSIDRNFREWVNDANPRQNELVAKAAKDTGASKPEVITALHALIATRVWSIDIFSDRLGPSMTYRFLPA